MDIKSLLPHRRQESAGHQSPPALGTLRPVHRIAVLVIVLGIVITLLVLGHSTTEALGLVLATGAVAAQLIAWLSGHNPPQQQSRIEGRE